jgi:hypothetical protein
MHRSNFSAPDFQLSVVSTLATSADAILIALSVIVAISPSSRELEIRTSATTENPPPPPTMIPGTLTVIVVGR